MPTRRLVCIVFLLTLAVRIVAALNTCAISADGPEYVKVAKWYLAGEYDSAVRHAYHPLYPILTATFYSVIGDWEAAGQAVSVLFSSLAVIPLFLLTRRLFDDRHALVASTLYAFWPYAAVYSAAVLTTGLYLFLFTTGVWAAVEAVATKRIGCFALAGLFFAMAYLDRVDGLVLVPAFAVGIVILLFVKEKPSRDREGATRSGTGVPPVPGTGMIVTPSTSSTPPQPVRAWNRILLLAAGSAVSAVVFLAVAFPFLSAIHEATGRWKLTMKMSSEEVTQIFSVDAGKGIASGGAAARTSVGLLAQDYAESTHYLIVVLLGVGLLQRSIRSRDRVALLFVLLVVAVNMLFLVRFGIVAGRMSRRYSVGLTTLGLPWAVAGLAYISTWIWRLYTEWRCRRKGMAAPAEAAGPFVIVWPAVAFGLIISVLACVPKTFVPTAWNKQDEVEAAEYIREHATAKPVRVMTYLERVAFYAEGEQVAFPAGARTTKEIVEHAQSKGVEFLAVDKNIDRVSAAFMPADCPDLEAVFASGMYTDGKNMVRVYRVKR
ncbi:MAG: glycosyltransferase family 39 protein [Planctomycetota bacterium]|nr:glycosyltransferase family 39 protein [Planctomycetota bacterium]